MPQSEQVIAPELQAKIIEYLEKAENAVARAGDFVADQAPDVIQQWLAWEFWGSTISGIVLFSGCVLSAFAFFKFAKAATESQEDSYFAGAFVSLVVAVLLFCASATESRHAIKVVVAPKVVVIEKFADLIKDVRR